MSVSQYLDKNDPLAHVDAPTPEDRLQLYQKLRPGMPAIRCPVCGGWGGHNLKVNAYALPPGMADTAQNRHAYRHFRSSCFQCNGWGWVADARDAECEHDYERVWQSVAGAERLRCRKCGMDRYVDSSD